MQIAVVVRFELTFCICEGKAMTELKETNTRIDLYYTTVGSNPGILSIAPKQY